MKIYDKKLTGRKDKNLKMRNLVLNVQKPQTIFMHELKNVQNVFSSLMTLLIHLAIK